MSRLLIRGARLLGAEAADLLVDDGVIREVGSIRAGGDVEVLDADGLVALPGLVDLHVHLREPGREDAETIATGSAAAAAGGYTAVFAMANTSPVTDTAEAAERVLDLGRACGLTQVVPVGAVTKGLEGAELAELGLMARSRAAVRVFSDDGHCVHDARVMRRALEYVKTFGGVVSQHAQDPRLAGPDACCHEGEVSGRLGLTGWPGIAEESIVARDVMLARHTGSRVHVAHVSTAGTVEVIRWAKAQGIDVTAEVTPHHLALTTDLLAGYDPVYKVNPPLRPTEDVEALRAALADGTIDAVATDHAPHARQDKEHAFPDAAFGMLGLETALSVVSEVLVRPGLLDWAGVARVMSSAPARIGGLTAQGRPLSEASPAHLTLVDPDREVTVDAAESRSRSRNNPWHGRTFRGAVEATVYGGRVTYDRGATSRTHRPLTTASTPGADL
ncbi:dihydroorotase [Humibacillus xanthopallidus]|uniref:Dihydroorotase n=1 Tax=Humibacillus xanthopallidus TaxID=412689 RepID=A0A543PVW6_9MICO|nr:dihydroorotase [Humibacillus xanthopallidus]TQN48180.1 dihydroorotase [Humibacillus xanthopallidus]